jgi:hypothetical protein
VKNKLFIGILIGMILVFLTAFAINNFASDTFKEKESIKDQLTETSSEESKLSHNAATDNGALSDSTSAPNIPSNDHVPPEDTSSPNNDSASTETTESFEDGLSRATAYAIDLDMEYSMTMEKGKQTNWFYFVTSQEKAVYRISVDPVINDTPIMASMRVVIYGEDNIKIDDIYIHKEEGFLDIILLPKTKYYLKVFVDESHISTGNYGFYVFKLPCDEATGMNKDAAIPIEAGKDYSGILTSTVSNWYVLDEPGMYTFILHNIDVGCMIEYGGVGEPGNAGHFSGYVKPDESSLEHRFYLSEYTTLYIEIKASNKTANGHYIFSIKKSN